MSRRGLMLFISLSIIWGLPYFFIKHAVAEIDPVATVFLRTAPAAIVLLTWSAAQGRLRSNLKYWKIALGFSVVEMVFPWWFISAAEQHLSSGLTGLLLATVPLFGVIIGRIRGDRTATSRKRIAGLAIGIVGVVALVGLDPSELHVTPLPLAMVLASAIGYAIGPVIISKAEGQADSATMIGLSLAMLSVLYLPLLPGRLPDHMPSALALESLAVLSVVCTVAAFLIFFALIAEIGPVRATLVTYINPAVAILLGVLFLAEPLTAGILIGFPLVLAGSYLASQR